MSAPRRALLLAAPALLVVSAARAGRVLRPDDALPPQGNTSALLWLHAHYTDGPPPDPPPFADRLTRHGWDLWRLDRADPIAPDITDPRAFGAADPIGGGITTLVEACATLRQRRYRRITILGESRGAFIALAALHKTPDADCLVAIAPAAHGTRAERKAQAMADFEAAVMACAAGPLKRLGLVLFAEDPYDPDPRQRASSFMAGARHCGAEALLIDRPPAPTGHGAARDPEFDTRFGARVAGFMAG